MWQALRSQRPDQRLRQRPGVMVSIVVESKKGKKGTPRFRDCAGISAFLGYSPARRAYTSQTTNGRIHVYCQSSHTRTTSQEKPGRTGNRKTDRGDQGPRRTGRGGDGHRVSAQANDVGFGPCQDCGGSTGSLGQTERRGETCQEAQTVGCWTGEDYCSHKGTLGKVQGGKEVAP